MYPEMCSSKHSYVGPSFQSPSDRIRIGVGIRVCICIKVRVMVRVHGLWSGLSPGEA